tara:strand:- start:108 stop:719 length:612 start_codon:yes stop_codon:yes gene_type:complete
MLSKKRSLCALLDKLAEETEGEEVSVKDLLDVVQSRSFGPVIFLLGFIAISPLTIIPGANWVVAAITLIFTAQIVLGFDHPWLPNKLLQFKFKREHLLKGTKGARGWAEVFDRILAPRLPFLTRKPFLQLIALICVIAALVTFPLGMVPFGPLLPGIAILVFGLGLMARDGVVILLAGTSLFGAILLLERLAERWLGLSFLWS